MKNQAKECDFSHQKTSNQTSLTKHSTSTLNENGSENVISTNTTTQQSASLVTAVEKHKQTNKRDQKWNNNTKLTLGVSVMTQRVKEKKERKNEKLST